MDFQLTADQVDLRDGVRKLCSGRFPIETLRASEGLPFWAELADSGVFALRQPEADGGVGLGMAEAALVFEELGRGLIPGPLVWSHLAAGLNLSGAEAGAGLRVVGGLDRRDGPVLIEHLEQLDDLVVVDERGIWLADPSSVTATSTEPLDPMTPVSVALGLPEGTQVGSPADAQRWRLEGSILIAAQLAGMASALVDLTVAYTKERKQFGRPVGSFQALKHTMADMLTKAELARTQVYAAAVHADDRTLPGTQRSASAAKVVAGRAALANGAASIQCHGGMGYTWEIDSHLYLKRAWVLDPIFGSADDHALAMADYLQGED